jgi:RNA polymerase sigma factor (sigma-70 family)
MSDRIRDIIRNFRGLDSAREIFSEADFEPANDPLPLDLLSESNRQHVSELVLLAEQSSFKVVLARSSDMSLDAAIHTGIFKNLKRYFPYLLLLANTGQAWALYHMPDANDEPRYIRFGDPDHYEIAERFFKNFSFLPSPFELEEVADEIFGDDELVKLRDELKESTDDVDIFHLYMKEVCAVKPQTSEEIVKLLEYMETIKGFLARCSDEEERKRYQADLDEMRDVLVKTNQLLVIWVANDFKDHNLDFLDLIQAGNFGLMKAIEKFDHKLGYKFSTYGQFWIRQAIQREIDNQRNLIRLPVHVIETYKKYKFHRQPWPSKIPIADIMNILNDPLSVDPSGTTETGFTLVDERSLSPGKETIAIMRHEQIMEWLEYLTEKEGYVIKRRFGLLDGDDRTLEEIGQELGLTRERIRQIESDALSKLRFIAKRKQIDLSSIL